MLKDAGESASDFGQLVIAAAMFAEFVSIILLTLFFSREATSIPTKLVLLGGFALLAVGFAFVLLPPGAIEANCCSAAAPPGHDCADSCSRCFHVLVGFVALASVLGLETILGAFVAGVILRLVDGDRMMTHPQFRQKLEAIGFGVFIPVFFVARGIRFDWRRSSQALRPFCVSRYFSRLCYLSEEYLLSSTVHLLAAVVRLSRGFYRQHRFRLSWLHRRSAWNWA